MYQKRQAVREVFLTAVEERAEPRYSISLAVDECPDIVAHV